MNKRGPKYIFDFEFDKLQPGYSKIVINDDPRRFGQAVRHYCRKNDLPVTVVTLSRDESLVKVHNGL